MTFQQTKAVVMKRMTAHPERRWESLLRQQYPEVMAAVDSEKLKVVYTRNPKGIVLASFVGPDVAFGNIRVDPP